MNKKWKLVYLLAAVVLCLTVVSTVAMAATKDKAVSVKFSKSSVAVKVSETSNLSAILTVAPKVKVVYQSSNSKVVTVTSSGVVKGVAQGKATITASVSQKGYAGKGSIVVNVETAPVKYKDLNQLDADVRKAVVTLYKKDYTKLSVADKNVRAKLLNIDRQQLITALFNITKKADPSWSVNQVQDFLRNNLEKEIPAIGAMFTQQQDQEGQQAVLKMLQSYNSPAAVDAFANMLKNTTDSNFRYSLCYLLSQFPDNPSSFAAILNILPTEKSLDVFSNAFGAAMNIAGEDTDKITQLLLIFDQLEKDKQSMYVTFLTAYDSDPGYHQIYLAWKGVIQHIQEAGTEDQEAVANEVWANLSKYAPYKG